MRSPALLLAVAALALGSLGCRGKLLAQARLKGPGTAEARFHAGQPVRLWAHYDGVWTGSKSSKMPVRYDVEVRQGGKSKGRIACDTEASSGTTICSNHFTVNTRHDADCETGLACTLPALAAGEAVLRVTARIGDPSRVEKVRDISLDVREP
jgi:hypothetical protein